METEKKDIRQSITCRIKTCGKVFLGPNYATVRPYSEVWAHIQNMHARSRRALETPEGMAPPPGSRLSAGL